MSAIRFVEFCERVLAVRFEPGQRAFWRVAGDRVQPRDLVGDDREFARELFGNIDAVPAAAFAHVALNKGADTGFSMFGGYRLLYRGVVAQELGAPGEVRPSLVVAPDLRTGRIPVRHALAAAEGVPAIKRMIVSSGSDGFKLQREGGRFTSVETLPASAGGRALRGRRYVEALFDESSYFRDANYDVNDVDCRRAVQPRTLGTFWMGGTPWLASSDLWRTYERNFGNPVEALAARMPTLLVRNDPRVVHLVMAARERDPEGAATEFDCEPPTGAGDFFFDPYAVDAGADESMAPVLSPSDDTLGTFSGFDPAFQRDACAGCVIREREGIFEVVEVFERRPTRNAPLVPSVVCKEFAGVAKRHGAQRCASDVHYSQSVREHLQSTGVTFLSVPGGNQGKAEVYNLARDLIHAGRVRWSARHHDLTRQLRDVIAQPLPGGLVAIRSPRRKGSHGDLASAFCAALWCARRKRQPAMIRALQSVTAIDLIALEQQQRWGI